MSRPEVDELTRRIVHLRYAVAAVGEAEHALGEAVTTARSAGASWDDVAEALGVSPSTAERQYGASTV